MHISFKIIKFYFTLCCSTCFGHHCVHHQELLIAAHAVFGHRVVLGRLFPPALFCCYCCFCVCEIKLIRCTLVLKSQNFILLYAARHVSDTTVSIIRSFLLLHM
jgi:hypothetical protein